MSEEPRYGTGKHGRPLWSERDCDAEDIRRTLRKARCREWSDKDPAGFVVQGGHDGVFNVACAADPMLDGIDPAAEIDAYIQALTVAGYRVDADEDDPAQAIEIRLPAGGIVSRRPRSPAGDGRRLVRGRIFETTRGLARWLRLRRP